MAPYLSNHLGKDYFFIFSIMANATLIQSMLDNAVHIGHKREYWSPKMRDYIYGIQNGVHVFDLYKTATKLEEVKAVLEDLSSKGKSILFVGTKVQSRDLVEAIATTTGQFYVNSKWVPGLLTNFVTIKKRIAYYNELETSLANGMLEGLTKKEKAVKLTELEKLKAAYIGVKDMKRTPDLVVVVDGHYEDLALAEAAVSGVTSIALLGSTGDIDKATYFVPCNVNSIKAIAWMLGELKGAIKAKKVEDKKPMARVETLAPKSSTPKTPIAKKSVVADTL
jgi:small subunit ribosomal protein S2